MDPETTTLVKDDRCKYHPDRKSTYDLGTETFDGAEARFVLKERLCTECAERLRRTRCVWERC